MLTILTTGFLVALFAASLTFLAGHGLPGEEPAPDRTETPPENQAARTVSLTVSAAFSAGFLTTRSVRFAVFSGAASLMVWGLVLLKSRQMAASRRCAIRRDLPVLIDHLVLQVESGHALIPAMDSALELFPDSSPLHQGLGEFDRHMKIGETVQGALDRTVRFLASPEAEVSFLAISNALRHGTPLGSVLRRQSVRMREHMILEGEKFASTASIKILGPLLFFIFPAAFLVIFSPVIVSLAGQVP